METEYNDPRAAFNKALESGRLILSKPFGKSSAINLVADYMYMGTRGGVDLFKNSDSREYLNLEGTATKPW